MKSSHPVAITILLGMIVTACAPAAAPVVPTEITESVRATPDGWAREASVGDGDTVTLDIINITNISTVDLEQWAALSESKMASRKSNILAVLWPVGNFVSEGGFSIPYNQHEVLITSEEEEFLIDEIDRWLSTQTCMQNDPEFKQGELETYNTLLME